MQSLYCEQECQSLNDQAQELDTLRARLAEMEQERNKEATIGEDLFRRYNECSDERDVAQAEVAHLREQLEKIVANRVADGGACAGGDCDCSECLARGALREIEQVTPGVQQVRVDVRTLPRPTPDVAYEPEQPQPDDHR